MNFDDQNLSSDRESRWRRRDAHQKGQALRPSIFHAMRGARRRPNYMARASFDDLFTNGEQSDTFQHKVKFILVAVLVDVLHLPWLQTVETNHQVFTLKQGGFVKLIGLRADEILVVSNVLERHYSTDKTGLFGLTKLT